MKAATIEQKERDAQVESLRSFLRKGDLGIKEVPNLIKAVLKSGAWKSRYCIQLEEEVGFDSFVDFVETAPLEGLGATVRLLERICADDKEALSALTSETTKEPHRPVITNDNIMTNAAEQGTSATYGLRRLNRQRPDLHQRVLNDELSPHAAMLEAGFREKRISIPIDPKRAATSILKYYNEEQIIELIENLVKELGFSVNVNQST